jgi:hypothetical protein
MFPNNNPEPLTGASSACCTHALSRELSQGLGILRFQPHTHAESACARMRISHLLGVIGLRPEIDWLILLVISRS